MISSILNTRSLSSFHSQLQGHSLWSRFKPSSSVHAPGHSPWSVMADSFCNPRPTCDFIWAWAPTSQNIGTIAPQAPALSLCISASGHFLKPTSYPSSFGLSWGTSEWHRERVEMASKDNHQPTGMQGGISIDPLSCPSEEQFRDTVYTISQRVLVLSEMETCLFIAITSSIT